MAIPATIDDLIQWGKRQEVSYRNLSGNALIENKMKNETIRIPLNSIMSEYRYFLEPYTVEIEINDEELVLYQFKPKSLSYKLYGTTELWAVLLMINNCVSKIDFNKKKIKVLDPKRIMSFINEVLILEKIIA